MSPGLSGFRFVRKAHRGFTRVPLGMPAPRKPEPNKPEPKSPEPHPKFSVTWMQVTDVCASVPSDPKSFTAEYDADVDSPTTGKVWLNLFVCAPQEGDDLDGDINRYSDQGSTPQQRTLWAVLDGDDERRIWDTSPEARRASLPAGRSRTTDTSTAF